MKNNYLFIIASIITFSSCRLPKYETHVVKKDPQIQLKNSNTIIKGESVEHQTGLFKDQIVVDDKKTYKTKDVAFYSTGTDNFANYHKSSFAKQVISGKINLFKGINISQETKMNSSGGFTTTQSRHEFYVIQQEGKKEVVALTYNNLKTMVVPNAPSYKCLMDIRKTRATARYIEAGGLLLMAVGLVATMDRAGQDKSAGPYPVFLAVGIGGTITGAIKKVNNRARYFRVIELRNKE